MSFSTWIDHTRWARNTWAMAAIFILTMADTIDMVSIPRPRQSGIRNVAATSDRFLTLHRKIGAQIKRFCFLLLGAHRIAALLLQLSCLSRVPDSGTAAVAPSSTSSLSGHVGCFSNPKYYSYTAVLALMATTMLVQVSHMVKVTLMLLITAATGIVNIYSWRSIFDHYDTARFQDHR